MEKQNVSNHEIILSPKTPVIDSKAVVDGAGTESKALVPVAPVGAEALAMVPVSQKMKRSEVSQRRTRRPFSVGEVEALVEAVEILGTGRYSDICLTILRILFLSMYKFTLHKKENDMFHIR